MAQPKYQLLQQWLRDQINSGEYTANQQMIHDTPVYYLEHLRRVRELLETKMDSFPSEEKDYYEMILYAVKQILGKQSRTK